MKREIIGKNSLGITAEHIIGAAAAILGENDYAMVFRDGKLEIYWPDRENDDRRTPFHGMMMVSCVRMVSDPDLLFVTMAAVSEEAERMRDGG